MQTTYEEHIVNFLDDVGILLEKPTSYLRFLEKNKSKLFEISLENTKKEDGYNKLPENEVRKILDQDREYFEILLDRSVKLHMEFQEDFDLKLENKSFGNANLQDMIYLFERVYEIIFVEVLGTLEGATLSATDPTLQKQVSLISHKTTFLVENMIEFTEHFKVYLDPQNI